MHRKYVINVSFRWRNSDEKSRKIIFFLLTPRCCSSVVLSIKQNFHIFLVAQRTKRSVFYGAGCFWRLPLLTGQKKIGENFSRLSLIIGILLLAPQVAPLTALAFRAPRGTKHVCATRDYSLLVLSIGNFVLFAPQNSLLIYKISNLGYARCVCK